jgi:hypothetical protein
MNTTSSLQNQEELLQMAVDFQSVDPDTSIPSVTQRDDLLFFSENGMVYRRHSDQFGNKVWLILTNVLNAVGWYHVESPFVHTDHEPVSSGLSSRTVNIYGDTHVNAYPGNGQVFKMSDVTYSTSPAFSHYEYNTANLNIGSVSGPLLQDFNKREWIYLYLKDAKDELVGYSYPLIPSQVGAAPWNMVPGRVYDQSHGLPTGASYHEQSFFNSALVEQLPIFCPTSYGKFPTSYELNGFGGWTDLTNKEPQTPDQFDSWQTVDQETEEYDAMFNDEVVQSVVDQVLNDPVEPEPETEDDDAGFTTPDSLSDSGVSSSSSSLRSQESGRECPVARELDYGSPSSSSAEGSVSSYTSSSSDSTYSPSEYSSEYSEDWTYDQDYDDWEEYRRDPFCGGWFTKDDFVDYYGDSSLWHMLSPEKEAERFMIETIIVRNRSLLSDKNVNHLLTKMLKTFMTL